MNVLTPYEKYLIKRLSKLAKELALAKQQRDEMALELEKLRDHVYDKHGLKKIV